MISEENFDENFNSLLLNNNVDGVGGSVEDAKGIGLRTSKDGLTQAIQDQLNSVETTKAADDGNYDKYHLRIKNAKQGS